MKKNILLVDDESDFREAVEACIDAARYNVVGASNTNDARLRLRFQPFDAIFLDINMPGQNGLQFLAGLRKDRPVPFPKIVVLSAMGFEDKAKLQMMSLLGIDYVLQKPISKSDIDDLLEQKLFNPVPKKSNYDTAVINAFLSATMRVIEANTQQIPIKEKPCAKDLATTHGEFSGIIQFSGKEVKGVAALSLDRDCVDALSGFIFHGANIELTDDLRLDLTGEICNQIVELARKTLQSEGHLFQISTPTLVQGRLHRIVHKFNAPCLILPFLWNECRFFVEFVLEV